MSASTQSLLQISKRAGSMPASPIRRLAPYAEMAAARGTKVFQLNIGQPDLPTPPLFYEAIAKAQPRTLEYSHSAGLKSYREKLARYYHKYSPGVEAEDVLITGSGSEALRFAFNTCLDPGDEVIFIEPGYANYISLALETGIRLKALTTYVEEDFALPPPEAFREAVTPYTRAILICNPANPTGKLYSPEEMQELKHVALANNLFLISDEVYSEFCYDGCRYVSALELSGAEEHVVVVDSISKRFSACGARIGSLVSRNRHVVGAALKFGQARLSPPTLGQIGAQALLDLGDEYYEEIRVEYVKRRDYVLERLNAMPGVVTPRVSGAFYVMPRLPVDDADDFCQWLLESFSHKGQTVMLAPAAGFYLTEGEGRDQVRIAYVLEENDLAAAMDCLAEALKIYPGRAV